MAFATSGGKRALRDLLMTDCLPRTITCSPDHCFITADVELQNAFGGNRCWLVRCLKFLAKFIDPRSLLDFIVQRLMVI